MAEYMFWGGGSTCLVKSPTGAVGTAANATATPATEATAVAGSVGSGTEPSAGRICRAEGHPEPASVSWVKANQSSDSIRSNVYFVAIEDKAHTGASSEDCSSNTRSSGINNDGATADIEAAAADLSIDADSIPVVHNSSDSSAEGTGDRGPSSTLCTNYSRNNNGDCNRKEVMGVDKSSEEGKESSKNCGVDTPAEHAGTRGHHTVLKDDEDSNREDTSRSLVAGHSGSSPPNDGSSSCDCPEPSIFNSSSTDIRRDDHRFFSPEDRTSTGSSSEPAAPMEAVTINTNNNFKPRAFAAGATASSSSANNNGNRSSGNRRDGASPFECSICMDDVTDPVVTRCGHLFCWGCLHVWLQQSDECPLCKAGVSADNVIPVYGRHSNPKAHAHSRHMWAATRACDPFLHRC
ncbi:mucin-19 [Cyclospora cayetanensis]|uniref:RING-type E3 ubiquitin transferase n=1 Tax=Cyclospora cayetanensis TaxID=88456 RepID=A0A6P6S159_9EIME|nr:mucin-19 [Cyclospora cayetanensis]